LQNLRTTKGDTEHESKRRDCHKLEPVKSWLKVKYTKKKTKK
jgi:hypothetical protein